MKTSNPVRGLLAYSYYCASGSLLLVSLVGLVLGAALLVTGNILVFNFFGVAAILTPPIAVIISIGVHILSKWERFLITMPVRRRDMVASIYIRVAFVLLAGVVFCGVVSGIGFLLHEHLFYHAVSTAFRDHVLIFGMILIMAALLYPLGTMPVFEKAYEGLALGCMLAALGVVHLASLLLNMAGLHKGVGSLLIVVVSVVFYVVSYFVARGIYDKRDF